MDFNKVTFAASQQRSSPKGKVYGFGGLIAGVGLAFSSFTQLRFIDGVGPGEILLVVVMVLSMIVIATRARLSENARVWSLYIPSLIVCLFFSLVGLLLAISRGTESEEWGRQYIFIAGPLLFPLFLWMAFGLSGLDRAFLIFSILVIAVYSALYGLTLLGISSFAGVELKYGWIRFRGLADNPNQAALAIGMAVPFIWWQSALGRVPTPLSLTFIAAGVIVGLATYSEALWVAWALMGGVAIAHSPHSTGKRGKSIGVQLLLRLIKYLLVLAVFGAGLYWLFSNVVTMYDGVGEGMGNNQGETRFHLWSVAVEAWMYAPVFGHGPGHFSGVSGPFLGDEAHNLLFDWLASYGIVGAILFFGSLIYIATRLLLSKYFILLSLLGVLMLLSIFHFYARHPVFWFAIFYCACVAGRKKFERASGIDQKLSLRRHVGAN